MAVPLPVTPAPLQPPAVRPLLAVGLLRDAAGSSRNYTSGTASGALLRYTGLDSYAWWLDPDLSAPVRVHLSESLTGVFTDAQIEVTHLPVDAATVELGDLRSIDTDVRPDIPWYTWRVASRSEQAGLVTLTGETLLARLARTRPREALILIAGQDGVPNSLDLRECLRRFLTYYGVPFVDNTLPTFFLRAGDDNIVPTPPAFVIQPNQQDPESLLDWLDRFFAPFRGYAFRADADDRLVVTPPAWVDTMGLRLTVYRRRQPLDRFPARDTARAPWSTTRAPRVEWVGDVDGSPVTGSLPDPLEFNVLQSVTIAGVDVRLTWTATGVQAMVYPPGQIDLTVGALYSLTFVFRPATADDDGETIVLLPADLAPDATVTLDAERVVNQATVRVQALDWQTNQQLMQAAALVLRSPKQLMAGAFGNNVEYGPMQADLETPSGFIELANDAAESGTWFWPVDGAVVMQPGGVVTVAYEVEEWAEQWRTASGPYAAGAAVNTYSDSAALPASGVEVKLFDFQFPAQTSIPSYTARGGVYGRWRPGDQPGIELRVGNSPRFAEWGFLWEGLGGQTVYFLWGFILQLNGTGTTFTTGDTTVHRFGYVQDGGAWEGGANVPGLSESQAAYPSRGLEVTLPYPVSEADALAIARGIVEENLHPRAVHQLTLVPSPARGWPLTPEDLGRVIDVPSIGLQGRLLSLNYDEAHSPAGSASTVVAELEETGAIPGARTSVRTYAAGQYGRSTYQEED